MSGRTFREKFPIRADSVPAARRRAVGVLWDWRNGEFTDAVSLIVSELAGNAVVHTGGGIGDFFEMALRRGSGALVVEVADSYQWAQSEFHPPRSDGVGGRGLVLVDAISHDWGVRPRQIGKTVWARLLLPGSRVTGERQC